MAFDEVEVITHKHSGFFLSIFSCLVTVFSFSPLNELTEESHYYLVPEIRVTNIYKGFAEYTGHPIEISAGINDKFYNMN